MGTVDPAFVDSPLHEVELDTYLIDVHEVTNQEYAHCVAAGACEAPPTEGATTSSYYDNPEYAHYPVGWMTWQWADGYCRSLGKRLPTEAEWEKAARGGCEIRGTPDCEAGVDSPPFPWGDEPLDCDRANYAACAGDTVEVGSMSSGASAYGVLHLLGNLSEWVADWYHPGYYDVSPRLNPPGPSEDESAGQCEPGPAMHSLRGRSFGSPPDALRVFERACAITWGFHHSFRCAADPE